MVPDLLILRLSKQNAKSKLIATTDTATQLANLFEWSKSIFVLMVNKKNWSKNTLVDTAVSGRAGIWLKMVCAHILFALKVLLQKTLFTESTTAQAKNKHVKKSASNVKSLNVLRGQVCTLAPRKINQEQWNKSIKFI